MNGNGSDLSGFSMMDLFRSEVETQVSLLNQELLRLESEPGAKGILESLMRAAHSIKGAARIVQVDAAVKVAHSLEDCFVAAQNGKIILNSVSMDQLLAGIDFLNRISLVSENELGQWQTEHAAETEKLVSSLSAIAAGSGVSAAPSAGDLRHPDTQTVEKTKAPTDLKEEIDSRIVRLDAASLDRLMGLAGETIIATAWLRPHLDSLKKLKQSHFDLTRALDRYLRATEQADSSISTQMIVDARQKAEELRQIFVHKVAELEGFGLRSANLGNRLYREVIAGRMRPFAEGTKGFPRMIRDLARQLGKQVHFEIRGKSTRVDRDILEKLEAPLNHLLRNAVDHGIETPEERIAAGKSPEAMLFLEATHRAGMLQIRLSDDGRGITMEQIRKKLLEKKLATPEMAAQLSTDELLEFLFLPGFSTSEKVTEISGRGVGLDVVYAMVQQVGGTVRIETQQNQKTVFYLQLPLTLSMMRALLVNISGEPYALPLSRIERTLTVPRDKITFLSGTPSLTYEGQQIPLAEAWQVLELPESKQDQDHYCVMVIGDRSRFYGLIVDSFLGQKNIVVRPLDRRLGKVQDVQAASIQEDGSPLLILDVQDLLRTTERVIQSETTHKISASPATFKKRKRILIVDDSLTVREVQRKVLESQGYEVETAVNGVDGWNAARAQSYDLIITDVDMPRMNGLELLSHIRNDPRLYRIPVIVVSYKDREEDRIRGLQAGANFYLAKSSFQHETLMKAVFDLIGEP